MDDQELFEKYAEEITALRDSGQKFMAQLDPVEAVSLLGQIQLACRCPGNIGRSRTWVESFARALQNSLSQHGGEAIRIMCDRGWNNRMMSSEKDEQSHLIRAYVRIYMRLCDCAGPQPNRSDFKNHLQSHSETCPYRLKLEPELRQAEPRDEAA